MSFSSTKSPPTLFPTYLVPSLPFRRRQSSSASTSSTASTASASTTSSRTSTTSAHSASSSISSTTSSNTNYSPPTSPISEKAAEPTYLKTHTSHLRCARCLADLALAPQIISKGFTGRHGRAYLVAPPPSTSLTNSLSRPRLTDPLPNLPNTYAHKPVPRQLVTGAHTVADLGCALCGAVLGWKYVAAEEVGQRYKVGKFILEMKRVLRGVEWEGDEVGSGAGGKMRVGGGVGARKGEVDVDGVEFDSQDEDECEDLFLGVWSPQGALVRRREKALERV